MTPLARVYVEISNICNLQCSFCPPVERASQVMSVELFARVARQLPGLTREICLHVMGEPLGHPRLVEILDIASQTQLPVNLTTNGVLLAPKQELCLRPVVRQVNISVHSFAANFSGRDVTPYMNHVLDFARRAMAERPDLYLNFRLWDLNHSHGETLSNENRAIREFLERAFDFRFSEHTIDIRRRKRLKLQGRLAVHFDSRFEWPSLAQTMRSETGFCHALSQHIGIHADGTVVPCCLDKEAVLALGNVHDQTLNDILASERAERMRSGFAQHQLREALCQRCEFIGRFAKRTRSLAPQSPHHRPN